MDYDKARKAIGHAFFAAFPMLFILLVCMKLFHIATIWLLLLPAALCVVWYALFGFVGLAHLFSRKKKIKLSNSFLALSFSPTLLPSRKAIYFWVKSDNLIRKSPTDIQKADFEKAFALAKKVNLDRFSTYNEKALFLSYLTVLYYDSGEKEKAYRCMQEARSLPHNEAVDTAINQIFDQLEDTP